MPQVWRWELNHWKLKREFEWSFPFPNVLCVFLSWTVDARQDGWHVHQAQLLSAVCVQRGPGLWQGTLQCHGETICQPLTSSLLCRQKYNIWTSLISPHNALYRQSTCFEYKYKYMQKSKSWLVLFRCLWSGLWIILESEATVIKCFVIKRVVEQHVIHITILTSVQKAASLFVLVTLCFLYAGQVCARHTYCNSPKRCTLQKVLHKGTKEAWLVLKRSSWAPNKAWFLSAVLEGLKYMFLKCCNTI